MARKSQFLACNIIWFVFECVIIKCAVAILFLGINSSIVFMQMVKGRTGDVANWLYGNGLEPSGNMPLPEPVLAKITDASRLILVKIRSNVTKWVRRVFKSPNHEGYAFIWMIQWYWILKSCVYNTTLTKWAKGELNFISPAASGIPMKPKPIVVYFENILSLPTPLRHLHWMIPCLYMIKRGHRSKDSIRFHQTR